MLLIYPVAKPIALVLDAILGQEIVTKYSKEEILQLLNIQQAAHNVLSDMEQRILAGTLKFREKTVGQVMTKLDRVNMLNVNERFDFEVLHRLFQIGNSRIPVYDTVRTNIIGLVYVKDCILFNPEDAVPVQTIMQCHGRTLHRVFDDVKLDAMLSDFKSWRSHIAIVEHVDTHTDSDPLPIVVGIITLEDVLEELLNEEFVDETDMFVSNETQERARQLTQHSLFNTFGKRVHSSDVLLDTESISIQHFLEASLPDIFASTRLSSSRLVSLLATSSVIDVMTRDGFKPTPIIFKGQRFDNMILILQGRVEVQSGSEGFSSHHGPLSVFGVPALAQDSPFVPDYVVLPHGPVRYLQISSAKYWEQAKQHAAQAKLLAQARPPAQPESPTPLMTEEPSIAAVSPIDQQKRQALMSAHQAAKQQAKALQSETIGQDDVKEPEKVKRRATTALAQQTAKLKATAKIIGARVKEEIVASPTKAPAPSNHDNE
eukprot:c10253_g1_i1.p1 GENE.c10253_g1_i1~~c10253_g1_i1.p1  ORF type:complete len:488 (+),score=131.34 c10253_g1_i1:127-1590(+)